MPGTDGGVGGCWVRDGAEFVLRQVAAATVEFVSTLVFVAVAARGSWLTGAVANHEDHTVLSLVRDGAEFVLRQVAAATVGFVSTLMFVAAVATRNLRAVHG